MRIGARLLSHLDLSHAASVVVGGATKRFPHMITDRCFTSSESALVKWVAARCEADMHVSGETLAMPRGDVGARPVTLMDAGAATAYGALIQHLGNSLDVKPREHEAWSVFKSIGERPEDEGYIVEFDISACYEYIDHAKLQQELIKQTMDVGASACVRDYLRDLFPYERGLPQMSASSDLLADTYLSAMERALLASGYEVNRYADDFRVLVPTWPIANEVVERAREVARMYGLSLAAGKTQITTCKRMRERSGEQGAQIGAYLLDAAVESRPDPFALGPYEQPDPSDTVDVEESIRKAMRRLLDDWVTAESHERADSLGPNIARAVAFQTGADEPLPAEHLEQIVFRQPLNLQAVCRYLRGRVGMGEGDLVKNSLRRLVAMGRQSPWAKLWLANTYAHLEEHDEDVAAWCRQQLKERHEVVRAEALWALASHPSSVNDALTQKHLYMEATAISRPAIVAAMGLAGASRSDGAVRAMLGDWSPSSSIYGWGASCAA